MRIRVLLISALLLTGTAAFAATEPTATPGAKAAGAEKCEKPSEFTDTDLNSLKKNSPEFLVYLWSPYMPLSLRGRREIDGLAAQLKIPKVAHVLDQNRRICHTKDGLFADPIFNSKELGDLNALNHFPTYAYYLNGKLAALVHGYEIPEKFVTRIERIRTQEKKK